MEVLASLLPARLLGMPRPFACRFIKRFVFFWRKPCATDDFSRCFVGDGKIWQVIEPSAPYRAFIDLSDYDDLLVHRAARGWFAGLACLRAVNAVFGNRTGSFG